MSMGEREREKKEESRFERYEDKRWKYSLCRDKIDPHLEVDAKKKKKNGWDRNFESREDVYK